MELKAVIANHRPHWQTMTMDPLFMPALTLALYDLSCGSSGSRLLSKASSSSTPTRCSALRSTESVRLADWQIRPQAKNESFFFVPARPPPTKHWQRALVSRRLLLLLLKVSLCPADSRPTCQQINNKPVSVHTYAIYAVAFSCVFRDALVPSPSLFDSLSTDMCCLFVRNTRVLARNTASYLREKLCRILPVITTSTQEGRTHVTREEALFPGFVEASAEGST